MDITGVKHKAIEIMCKAGLLTKKIGLNLKKDNFQYLIRVDGALLNVSTTNNVFELWIDGGKKYLRLCDKHVQQKELVESLINKYERITGIVIPERIHNQLTKARNKLLRMGYLDDFSSPVYQFFKTSDFSVLNLDLNNENDNVKEMLKSFIHFAWSEIASYNKNYGTKGFQLYNYNRCKCQENLYELYGVGRLICKTQLVWVNINGYESLGYIMEQAEGVNPLDLNKEDIHSSVTDQLADELNILNTLDVICNEGDHRPGNYNLLLDESKRKAISIQAFDNDSDTCFFPTCSINKQCVGASSLLDKNGCVSRKSINEDFRSKLLSIEDKEVAKCIENHLNNIQQRCLLKRLHRLKKALERTRCRDQEPNINVKDYLFVLMNWQEADKDQVLLEQQHFNKIKIDNKSLKLWLEKN